MHDLIASAQQMTDEVLLASAHSLVGRERRLTAVLMAHLAELDTRGLAHKKGFSSLLAYCRTVLGFSEAEACGRIEAARAARRFPLVLDLLKSNELTMTAAGLLGRHLTPENHEVVLRAARGKTKEQIKEIVAGLHPRPDIAPTIRAVAAVPWSLRLRLPSPPLSRWRRRRPPLVLRLPSSSPCRRSGSGISSRSTPTRETCSSWPGTCRRRRRPTMPPCSGRRSRCSSSVGSAGGSP